MSFCLYNKKNFTRRLEDMNFIFSLQKKYFTHSLRSFDQARRCDMYYSLLFLTSKNDILNPQAIKTLLILLLRNKDPHSWGLVTCERDGFVLIQQHGYLDVNWKTAIRLELPGILCICYGVQNYHVSRRFSEYIMKRQMKTVPPFVIVCLLDRLSQQLRLADFLKDLAL